MNECAGYISLTMADETNNQFVDLGGAGFLTKTELMQEWDHLPSCAGDTVFVADLLDENGDIISDKPISAETIEAKVGKSISVLITEGRERTNQHQADALKSLSQQWKLGL